MDEKKGDPKRVSLYFDFRKKVMHYPHNCQIIIS